MNTNQSSAQLKSLAKGQLLGKYGTAVGACLLTQVCMSLLSLISLIFIDRTTMIGYLFYLGACVLISLFSGIFAAGAAYIYLNFACGSGCRASDVFYGFSHHADKALLIQLFLTGTAVLCAFPLGLAAAVLAVTGSPLLILPVCICLILFMTVYMFIRLTYSQAFFLLLDFPDYSVRQILSLSRQIMKGHKARLFYILVSFIPLRLLSLLSCGIGLLWIIPYQNSVQANFYLDLMRSRSFDQRV